MGICRICIKDAGSSVDYHRNCLMDLFGSRKSPHLDVDLGELFALAAQQAGKMSISGVQAKVLAKLSEDQSQLEVVESGSRFIIKPQQAGYSHLPENEHLTMQLARIVEIDTPANGLLSLKDDSLAYVVKRFDRLDDGTKLQVEDFCQLAGQSPKEKYSGSAELCVRLLNKYASEPLVEIRKLYRQILFGWWVGNGDLHLKNLSMLTPHGLQHQLSPAYDLVSTVLVIADDDLALPVLGKKQNLTRRTWMDFGSYCELPPKAVEALLSAQAEALEPSIRLVRDSFLPPEIKQRYEAVITDRTRILNGGNQG
ncbi:MAG: HipA domain-containing protein [Planctomycetota bacterium]|nr:HipA domain-containing protein [Planctomycetota bacterium]